MFICLYGATAMADTWKVYFDTRIQYLYYDAATNEYCYSNYDSTTQQSVYVEAATRNEAIRKANEKCAKMCLDKEFVRTETIDGTEYKVYRHTSSTVNSVEQL